MITIRLVVIYKEKITWMFLPSQWDSICETFASLQGEFVGEGVDYTIESLTDTARKEIDENEPELKDCLLKKKVYVAARFHDKETGHHGLQLLKPYEV